MGLVEENVQVLIGPSEHAQNCRMLSLSQVSHIVHKSALLLHIESTKSAGLLYSDLGIRVYKVNC